jgi:toxin ParE1/3/4
MKLLVSPRARGDLAEIWTYTAERWSAEQADRYIRSLYEAMTEIAMQPLRGRPCDDVRPGYRRYSVGSHVLFYRVPELATVEVVRVLHQSMDFNRRL